MILPFINIRKVPQEMLKTSGFTLGFQHLPRDLANVNEWKIMFDPYIKFFRITVNLIELPHNKTNKMTGRPAKARISLGIRPV